MDLFQIIGISAGTISFLSFFLYYVSIFKKKTIPNRATWFILTIVGILIFSSYYSVGARETIWVPFSFILGPLIVFILSLKYGEGGWTKFDILCISGTGLSLIFWYLSGSALITLLINILIDLFGILPTIKKSYLRPWSEDSLAWFLTLISSILNLFAISVWSFEIWIYPMYMVIINGLITVLLCSSFSKNR